MDVTLNATELRVLGSLIEKELTTPEYYPLSLNALVNACNQKSNREPVMTLDESDVTRALDSLRFKQYAIVSASGGRVAKYRHGLVEKFRFTPAELAILCELMVRGPQTIGELRGRGERMHQFTDLAEVESVLGELLERTPPLVAKLPLQPGRKEPRYCQLFSGEPDLSELAAQAESRGGSADSDKIARLELELSELREEVAALRQTVADFKKSFE
ncbi:MAG TPA: DUF480 domain-containing protein [Geobacter sp.]|nr:DUF480 domain-containing protein [Geobacter sp.]